MFRGSVCSRNCRIVQHRKAIVDADARGQARARVRAAAGVEEHYQPGCWSRGAGRGTSTLTGALDSEDTRVMIDSLRRLGIDVESRDEGTTLIVHGCGGKIPASSADLFVGNSGTTIRFLTAMCALGHGTYRLDGIERMRERPIGDLLDALKQLGVNALMSCTKRISASDRAMAAGRTAEKLTVSRQPFESVSKRF